jgi:hypothetical protein
VLTNCFDNIEMRPIARSKASSTAGKLLSNDLTWLATGINRVASRTSSSAPARLAAIWLASALMSASWEERSIDPVVGEEGRSKLARYRWVGEPGGVRRELCERERAGGRSDSRADEKVGELTKGIRT